MTTKGIISRNEDTKSIIKMLKNEGIPMVVRRFSRTDDLIIIETDFLKWIKMKGLLYFTVDVKTF